MYDWNFSRLWPYSKAFITGAMATVELSLLVILLGTLLGVLLGMCLRNRWVRMTSYPLLDACRALPPLVLILIFYYELTPHVVGWSASGFTVFVISMSLQLAVFVADLFRASMDGIPRSLVESGKSLGMTEPQSIRYLYLPHLLRALIAPLTALYIGMVKTTSLASIINVNEVVYAAQTVTVQTSRSLEAWVVVGAVYIAMVLPATYLLRWLERVSRSALPPGLRT